MLPCSRSGSVAIQSRSDVHMFGHIFICSFISSCHVFWTYTSLPRLLQAFVIARLCFRRKVTKKPLQCYKRKTQSFSSRSRWETLSKMKVLWNHTLFAHFIVLRWQYLKRVGDFTAWTGLHRSVGSQRQTGFTGVTLPLKFMTSFPKIKFAMGHEVNITYYNS